MTHAHYTSRIPQVNQYRTSLTLASEPNWPFTSRFFYMVRGYGIIMQNQPEGPMQRAITPTPINRAVKSPVSLAFGPSVKAAWGASGEAPGRRPLESRIFCAGGARRPVVSFIALAAIYWV
jgi:hypothetical protein